MNGEIAVEEFAERLARLRELVKHAGLDVFIVTSEESVYYLTGAVYAPLERPFFLLIDTHDRADMLVPQLEVNHMRKVPSYISVQAYREFPAPTGERWNDRLEAMLGGALRVGIEPTLPHGMAVTLGGRELAVRDFVGQLRLVKSAREIELLRRSGKFAVRATELLMGASRYGASIAAGAMQKSQWLGEVIHTLPTWEMQTTNVVMATWAGARSADPHSIPDMHDVMREGPNVALVLSRINGYSTESERTYFVAPPRAEERELFELMLRARDVGFAMIRPGVRGHEIDAAVTGFLAENGQRDRLLHRTGHGFGLGAHEGPYLAEGSDDVLAENMVISIEPGIYIPGHGGFRHSDSILVTDTGYEVLTPYPTALAELTLLA